jgi:hypothetical protein
MPMNTPVDLGMGLVMIVAGLIVPLILIAVVWHLTEALEKRLDRLERRLDLLIGKQAISPDLLDGR